MFRLRLHSFLPLLLVLFCFAGCETPSPKKGYQPAMFEGGGGAVKRWVAENTIYPYEAVELGIEGKVQVMFVVSTDGSVKNVSVQKFAHPLLDKEALRVVKSMPKWTPAYNNGKPVNTIFRLPVTFKLQ